MSRRTLVVAALGLLAGCAAETSLDLAPKDQVVLEEEARGASVEVAPVRDGRPAAEVEGRDPEVSERTSYYVYTTSTRRGDVIPGDDAFAEDPLPALRGSLVRYLDSVEGLGEVGQDLAAPDYVLDVEVLHLAAVSFAYERDARVLPVVPIPVDLPGVARRYVPHATAALRLRLRDADGRLVAERVASSPVLGQPEEADAPNDLAAQALEGALHRARGLVASWVAADRALDTSLEEALAEQARAHDEGHTFWLHAVLPDRTGVRFAEVRCPSGAVLRTVDAAGPALVGPPEVWHVSPFRPEGVALPPVVYAALTQHLADEGFDLQRVEQVSVYRYFGP